MYKIYDLSASSIDVWWFSLNPYLYQLQTRVDLVFLRMLGVLSVRS